MIVNVLVAIAMAAFVTLPGVFILAVVGILVCWPLVVVETYLYRKKKGVYYQWKEAPQRPPRDLVPRHRIRRYAQTAEAETAQKSRARTRLFESSSATAPVSRASLLLTVGDELAEAGKNEAAQKCYRQILERFAGTPEAEQASRHLKSPAHGGRLISG